MYKIFDDLEKQLKNKNLTKEEKVQLIEKAGDEYRKKVDDELNKYLAKQYVGAALEIGSAAIPVSSIGKVGAEIGLSFLKPYIGRKIAQEIGTGAAGGYLSGSVFGFGEGLLEDKNPFQTAIEDANTGMLLGGALGGLGEQIKKIKLGNKLQQYEGNVFDYSKDLKKQFNQDAKKFYQDFIQERVLDKNGKFTFTGAGLQEILNHNPNQAKKFLTLIDDIKKATRLPNTPNIKPEQKPNVSHYEVYQGKNGTHKIEVSKSKKKRYYFTQSDASNGTHRPNKAGSIESIYNTIKESIPTNSGGRNDSVINIIKHIPQNFNPSQMTIPLIETIHIPMTEGNNSTFNLRVEKTVDKYGNPIFTPQEIGNMTPEEFSQNEAVIMQQVKDGLIQNQQPKIDYSNYKNPLTGSEQIFTREDIAKMSTKEYSKYEKAINAQLNSIGIPTSDELKTATGTIYVHSYKRADGTQVSGYYRSK